MAPKSNDDPNPTQENDSTLNEADDERMDAEEAEEPEEEDVDEEALEEFEETKGLFWILLHTSIQIQKVS